MFRFQTGSIKSLTTLPMSIPVANFDSKLVRLKGFKRSLADGMDGGFDSKLVRLKVKPEILVAWSV